MSWLFAYYVDSRYGFIYNTPQPWFNVDVVTSNCTQAVFHCSETHKLHKYGGHLKNFGLRTAFIIETPSQEEAVLLRLLSDQIVNQNPKSKSQLPVLQLILENPDWNALDALSEPLEAYKRLDVKRKADVKATNLLQKQIDRMNMSLDDLDGSICDSYRDLTVKFVEDSYAEIERIRAESRTAARRATIARRLLARKLLSYSTFSLSPNLK